MTATLEVAALATLLWGIGVWYADRKSVKTTLAHLLAHLVDEAKNPRTDVTLVGVDGTEMCPDSRGLVYLPSSWANTVVSIRDRNWREIGTVLISSAGPGPQMITIPR